MNFLSATERFGLRYPIFQAPTGSIAGPELAAAVSHAGGMGAMALTWTSAEQAADQVRQVRAATAHPFLVNFALAFPPLALQAALEAGAPIIAFSWGDPTPYRDAVRTAGAQLAIQVTNVAGAHRALQLDPDLLICQGIEAGGHVQSTTSLWDLLPRLLAVAGETPVISAGGISTGGEMACALALGASGVMLGTRFVATRESRAHPEYKRALIAAASQDAALTVCFDGGWPYAAHRVLRNATLERWEAAGCPQPGHRPGEAETVALSATGEPILRYEDTAPREGMTGDVMAMCLYSGTGCGAIQDIPPAAELITRLWSDCQQALASVQ